MVPREYSYSKKYRVYSDWYIIGGLRLTREITMTYTILSTSEKFIRVHVAILDSSRLRSGMLLIQSTAWTSQRISVTCHQKRRQQLIQTCLCILVRLKHFFIVGPLKAKCNINKTIQDSYQNFRRTWPTLVPSAPRLPAFMITFLILLCGRPLCRSYKALIKVTLLIIKG